MRMFPGTPTLFPPGCASENGMTCPSLKNQVPLAAAAADAGTLRLDHVERQQGRKRRVRRASALPQHLRARVGCARIGGADHSWSAVGGRNGWGGAAGERDEAGDRNKQTQSHAAG